MRVAVVEDEEDVRSQLLTYLKQYEEETGMPVQAEAFCDGSELAEKYEYETAFDVVLLDIEMERLDGMKTARLVRARDTDVILIFITNMAQFVMEGYKVSAMDFVLKPISYYMFREKMKKSARKIESRAEKFVIARSREGIYKIYTKDILYIEVQNHALIYHTLAKNFVCSGSLKKVEKDMKGTAFARCSASYLVHFSHIKKVEQEQLIMDNGDVLPIGKTRKKQLMELLTDYYGGRNL